MKNNRFIGTGVNPDGPDLPLGLGMRLAQSESAMETFGNMSNTQKTRLINHIQGAVSGDEAKFRVEDTVAKLSEGRIEF